MYTEDYVRTRALDLQAQLDTLDKRIKTEQDIVLKEMVCEMYDQRKQHMLNHAGRNPIEFAKLIAGGIIDGHWIMGLFTEAYDTRKKRQEIKTILQASDNPDIVWYIKNR